MTDPAGARPPIVLTPSAVESAEFHGALRTAAYVRLELFATIVMDGAVLLAAYLVAAGLSWTAGLVRPEDNHWSLALLRLLLDVGLVGAVMVITVFDLAKRIKNAYRSLKA